MSSVKIIKNVHLSKKTVTVDFNDANIVNEVGYAFAQKTDYTIDENLSPTRIYNEGGGVQLFSGNIVYYYKNGEFIPVTDIEFSSEPNVVYLRNNAGESLLLYNEEVAEFHNDGSPFNLEFSKIYTTAYERIFQAFGREVYVTKGFNSDSGSFEYSHGLCYRVDVDDGDIVGLAEYGDYILVLCENKLIRLSFLREPGEVIAERLLTPHFTAKKESLAVCGDKAVFLSGDNIAVLKGKNLTFVKLPSGISVEDVYTHCSSNGSLYVIPFKREGVKYLCVYDVNEGDFASFLCNATALSKKGALFFDEEGGISTVKKGEKVINTILANGVKTQIDGCGRKILLKVEIHAKGKATLFILSDAGEKVYSIKDGCNEIRCNICSREFTFRFDEKSEDFYAEKTSLTYTLLGG